MIETACQCNGWPAHDHRIPKPPLTPEIVAAVRASGEVYEPYTFDPDDVGRVWVDWKAVARGLMEDAIEQARVNARWAGRASGLLDKARRSTLPRDLALKIQQFMLEPLEDKP